MQGGFVGLIAGAVLVIAIVVGPALLGGGTARQQARALEQAEAARRLLSDYDVRLALAAGRIEMDALKAQDASVATKLEQDASANKDLLSAAAEAVRAAQSAGRDVVGVGEMGGLLHLTRAAEALDQARLLRVRVRSASADAVAAAQALGLRQIEAAAQAGVETAPVLEGLSSDRTELDAALAEANSELAAAESEIQKRETELATLEEQMRTLRASLLSIEGQGFQVGNDSAFHNYADQYTRTSQQLVELQRREHLLSHGGLDGATLDPESSMNGPIEGGEARTSLDDLRFRRDQAAQRVQRLQAGLAAIDASASTARAIGDSASAQAAEQKALVEKARQALDAQFKTLQDLAEAARAREEESLAAAQEAVSAFQQAKSAAEAYQRAAQTVQREHDPQRLNPRLRSIIDDEILTQQAETSAAEANILIGKAQVERAERLARQIGAIQAIRAAAGESAAPDPKDLETALGEARGKATEALTAARETYAPLAEGTGPTAWIYQGALATVHCLMADVHPEQGEAHLFAAQEALNKALNNIAKSPYAAHLVRLQAHLKAPPPAAPQPAPTSTETPAETTPG